MMLPEWVTCLTAPNPGPYTLGGTNTWILNHEDEYLVVDPGPDDPDHLDLVAAEIPTGATLTIVATHWHHDHTDGIAGLLNRHPQAHVAAWDEAWCLRHEPLRHNGVIRVGKIMVLIYGVPGHSHDSIALCALGPGGRAGLISGDTLLGEGTSVIQPPDGDLAEYLASLDMLAAEIPGRAGLWPGHGPTRTSALDVIAQYRAHRQERLKQVRSALAAGYTRPAEIRAAVYADVPPELHQAAEDSIVAQLRYLSRHGL